MIRLIAVAASIVVIVGQTGPASAKGCIKGAVIGGVASHYAGHGVMTGAVTGCWVGYHQAKKAARAPTTGQATNPPK
jgi:hypothetical protein